MARIQKDSHPWKQSFKKQHQDGLTENSINRKIAETYVMMEHRQTVEMLKRRGVIKHA